MELTKVRKSIENILYKSSVNKDFRKKCLRNGTPVFTEETKIDLDKDVTIEFIENKRLDKDIDTSGKNIVFILPDYVGSINKLNRDDLEKITGGVSDAMHHNNHSISALMRFF